MRVTAIPAFTDNYIWAIHQEGNPYFTCVDPGEADPVIQFAQENNLQLKTILITHHHPDHIGGVGQLRQHYPACAVYGPRDPRIDHLTQVVEEGQKIDVDHCRFLILFNPGHTATHISYHEPQQGWLFCGDTLFSAGCGRVFDGTMEQLHRSMLLFKSLPPPTQVYCAHEYTAANLAFAHHVEPHNKEILHWQCHLNQLAGSCSLPSTIERELLINPFLRTDMPAVQQFAAEHGAQTKDSLAVFTVLRRQKNEFVTT